MKVGCLFMDRLIYGMYPEILCHQEEQKELLKELVERYLYKDIFTLGIIKKPTRRIAIVTRENFRKFILK
jgi:predicted AAA+ superfamily ATPase